MSMTQTQFRTLYGWGDTDSYYQGPVGSGAIPGDFSVSLMVQPLFPLSGAGEALLSAYDASADTGFAILRVSGSANTQFQLTVGEAGTAEAIDVPFAVGTVVGRPLILTFTLSGDTLVAYANGAPVLTTTLAAPFASANASKLRLGGAGSQIAGLDATTQTGILGAALAYSALSGAEVQSHAMACMAAHRMVPETFEHAWAAANNLGGPLNASGAFSAPLTLTDSNLVTPIPLVQFGGGALLYTSDVGYGSPLFVAL